MPAISMDVKAHYVTQSSAYDGLLRGKVLTDRRIKYWQERGYFGGVKTQQRKEKQQKKRRPNLLKSILLDFNL